MEKKAELTTIVVNNFRDIIESRGDTITQSNAEDMVLFGEEGALSSSELVALIVAVEQAVEEKFDVYVSLANDRAFSQRNSPYRSIRALVDFALEELVQAGCDVG
jgi:acyl carrier protein